MTPVYIIEYEGKDVTNDFSPLLESIIFREYLENKAAELELVFNNSAAYFLNDWYPAINDKLTAKLGYKEGTLINAGTFYVDDITLMGGRYGETASFRAISAYASTIYSDEQRKNREGAALQELVDEEASRLNYSAKGDLSGTWSGIQKGTGFQFLEQLARETGRVMKVEATDLIFFLLSSVKKGVVVGIIDKADVIDYSLTDKAAGRISKCTVKHWDKARKQLIKGVYDCGITGGGSRTIWEEVADASAAAERAKNYVENWNKQGVRFDITIPGNVDYRAGVRLTVTGFGRFDKTWYIAEAQHVMSKTGGYTTTITLQE
jgi:phage protein D